MSTIAGMPDPLDPIKKNAQQPLAPPTGLDPMEGLKNMARDAANATRGQFAPQPRPAVNPLMGPDTGSTVLPMLQAADTYMRGKTGAAISNAKDVPGTVMRGVQSLADAGRAENQRIQAIDNTPTERPGTVMGELNNLGSRIKNGLLDAGVLSPEIVSRGEILTPDQQHGVKPQLPQATYSNEGRGAAAPAPAAPVAAPAPMPAATPEQKVQLAALISKQNNSRTPVSDPYAPVPGTQAPAGGMPAPGGSGGADLNGTPSQQTAYWAQQKAGLQERERYADQQAAQQQAFGMMQADQDFKREMFNYLKDNGEKLGPAATQAIAHMSGQTVGANQPASSGLASLASMANHMAAAAGDAEKNALTARGQDLTYAGHMATGKNDMSKAQLQADVTREGYAARAAQQAASDAAAGARNAVTADATKFGYTTQAETERNKLAKWVVNPLNPNEMINGLGETRKPKVLVPKQ